MESRMIESFNQGGRMTNKEKNELWNMVPKAGRIKLNKKALKKVNEYADSVTATTDLEDKMFWITPRQLAHAIKIYLKEIEK